jgi:putative ABC transport system permease protein
MASLLPQLRSALRMWRRNPGFALVAVAALALGIGANTAIFSVVNAVLLRPLPYPDPGRVGIVWEQSVGQGWNRINPSGPNYVDYREQSRSFAGLALIEVGTGTVTGFGEPQQFPGLRVSTNLLTLLGATPLIGRDFKPEEGWKDRVVILSYGAWQKWLGGDPGALGRRVIADGIPYTIIGVTRPDMWLPMPAEAFVPWSDADLRARDRMDHSLPVLARLRHGVTYEQASAELNAIEQRISAQHPRMKGWTAAVYPLQDAVVGKVRPLLLTLLAAVGMVLLIACTNLANLLLARAAVREREMSIRAALGASRMRLVRQFLLESMALALAGGLLGLLLAYWGVDLLNNLVPATIRMPDSNADLIRPHIAIDGGVLLFTLGVSLATGLIFGLLPAIAASRAGVYSTLKDGSRSSASAAKRHMQSLLVVGEVALALILLIAASLTIKSFWNLQRVDPGFRAAQSLVLETELPTDSKYRSAQEQRDFFRRVLANLAAIPGVGSVGITCSLPMDETNIRTEFSIEGRPMPPSGQNPPAEYRSVSSGYFSAMGIPLLAGRGLAESDDENHPPVMVIDDTLARQYWPAGVEGAANPIGQRIRLGRITTPFEIVGIAGAVRNGGLDRRPEPTVYVSYLQRPDPHVSIVLRHPLPGTVIQAAKSAIYAVDRDQPVFKIRTLGEVVNGSQSSTRFTILLLGAFGLVALVLASIGIYGVLSYAVSQQTVEIGIRMALGAESGSVLRMVVGRGVALAAVGIVIGILGAFAVARLLSALLYNETAHDPVVFGAAAIVLALVGALASYVPARRATRIDPVISLRYE